MSPTNPSQSWTYKYRFTFHHFQKKTNSAVMLNLGENCGFGQSIANGIIKTGSQLGYLASDFLGSLTEWRQESLPYIIGLISSNCSKNMYCTVLSLIFYLYFLLLKNQKWWTCVILFKFVLLFHMLRNINMVLPLPKMIFFPSLWSLHNFIILMLYLHKNIS